MATLFKPNKITIIGKIHLMPKYYSYDSEENVDILNFLKNIKTIIISQNSAFITAVRRKASAFRPGRRSNNMNEIFNAEILLLKLLFLHLEKWRCARAKLDVNGALNVYEKAYKLSPAKGSSGRVTRPAVVLYHLEWHGVAESKHEGKPLCASA